MRSCLSSQEQPTEARVTSRVTPHGEAEAEAGRMIKDRSRSTPEEAAEPGGGGGGGGWRRVV